MCFFSDKFTILYSTIDISFDFTLYTRIDIRVYKNYNIVQYSGMSVKWSLDSDLDSKIRLGSFYGFIVATLYNVY